MFFGHFLNLNLAAARSDEISEISLLFSSMSSFVFLSVSLDSLMVWVIIIKIKGVVMKIIIMNKIKGLARSIILIRCQEYDQFPPINKMPYPFETDLE